jgi:hypothetical protein
VHQHLLALAAHLVDDSHNIINVAQQILARSIVDVNGRVRERVGEEVFARDCAAIDDVRDSHALQQLLVLSNPDTPYIHKVFDSRTLILVAV